jgi:hypothetical protein
MGETNCSERKKKGYETARSIEIHTSYQEAQRLEEHNTEFL